MRIIFFGTGRFAIPSLERLISSKHEVVAVVTQPDKKQGRGWNVVSSPVKASAGGIAPALEVFQPDKASENNFINILKRIDVDVYVVVDYGQILGKEILSIPKKYCINLHPSLLPKYRGASPVNYAILNGDKETGNTVMKMNERMDAGDIISQNKTPVWDEEDAAMLSNRLALLGGDLLLKTIDVMEKGEEILTPQDEKESTYAPKLKKSDGKIDWHGTSGEIILKTRAFQPWPGVFTVLAGKTLKILDLAERNDLVSEARPGTIIDRKDFVVKTGSSALEVRKLQLEGKKAMLKDEFLRGQDLSEGAVLE